MNIFDKLKRLEEDRKKTATLETSKSKVIRIVNLAKHTRNYELKAFLKEQLNLQGEIKDVYIRNDYNLGLVFAYVIFEFSCDAMKAVEMLNCFHYKSLQLDVAQIAPNGNYKIYSSSRRLGGHDALWERIIARQRLKDRRVRDTANLRNPPALVEGGTENKETEMIYNLPWEPQSVKDEVTDGLGTHE